MRLRAVIIDDEETGIEALRPLIEKHITEIKIVGETTSARKALTLIEDYMPEIVFLDISMPEMNGFELLEQLAWKDFHLVFTTAHQEHGLKALKLNAADYLLKPIDHRDLRNTIDRIIEQRGLRLATQETLHSIPFGALPQPSVGKLAVNSETGVEFIDPSEIISLESRSNYTLISLNNSKEILTPRTLKEFETKLCLTDSHFMRVHHSFVVNLHKVLRYLKTEDEIIMVNNKKIPLAKSRKKVFYDWLNM